MGRQNVYNCILWVANYQTLRTTALKPLFLHAFSTMHFGSNISTLKTHRNAENKCIQGECSALTCTHVKKQDRLNIRKLLSKNNFESTGKYKSQVFLLIKNDKTFSFVISIVFVFWIGFNW